MTIGESLQALREQQGVSREELAKRLRKDRSVIARAESPNANPRWSTVQDHLSALGCGILDLAAAMQGGRLPEDGRDPEALADDLKKMLALRSSLNRSARSFAAQLRKIEDGLLAVTDGDD